MANNLDYENRKLAIGERIRHERKAHGLSQEELASKVSEVFNGGAAASEVVSQGTISTWENGRVMPPIDRLACLAEVFECDVGYLLCDYDRRNADAASVRMLTGLSGTAADNLVAVHNQTDYMASFRMNIISDILESPQFFSILKLLETAYLASCGADKGDEQDAEDIEEAFNAINALNLGGVTKYTAYKGKESAELQIQNAGFQAQTMFKQIIEREVADETNA